MNQSRFHPDSTRHTAMQISERDLEIIAATVEHQILTVEEIRKLFFSVENGYKATARRLQMLWNAGFLKRQWIPSLIGSTPAIYSVTQSGIQLLMEAQKISLEELSGNGLVTPATLRHELSVNKLIVSLMVALAEHYDFWLCKISPSKAGGNRLTKRLDLCRLKEIFCVERGAHLWDHVANPDATEKARHPHIPIRPDRLLILKLGEHWKTFFVEVEIAAKSQARFRRRVRGYRAYYSSDGFLRQYGEGTDRKQYPFHVLITVPSEERLNNLVELAVKEKALRICWFGVYEEIIANPLGNVWLRGEEYATAIASLSEQDKKRMYATNRRLERDAFIRGEVRRLNLLEG